MDHILLLEEGINMGKIKIWPLAIAFLTIAVAIMSQSAAANLFPTLFGFPVIVHSGNAVSFSNDAASLTDNEQMNIGFPQFDSLMATGPSSGLNSTMPQGMDISSPGNGMSFPTLTKIGSLFDTSHFMH